MLINLASKVIKLRHPESVSEYGDNFTRRASRSVNIEKRALASVAGAQQTRSPLPIPSDERSGNAAGHAPANVNQPSAMRPKHSGK
jgi:hypothetical protein